MPIYIKTEVIKEEYLVKNYMRKQIINEHINWINKLHKEGINIKSGFLVDEFKKPGAGGLLFLEVETYEDAIEIIKNDPMIKNNIVEWKLNEWINVNQE